MKKLYIVLTRTASVLSRVINVVKNSEYGHVSISLDKDLNRLYSFGRLNPYNPFIGGFVKEGIETGTFKRFKDTTCLVMEINVTDEQYENAERIIENFYANKEAYKYNVEGLFLAALGIKLDRPDKFYCSEFVKYLLMSVQYEYDFPEIIAPCDFQELESKRIYEGYLRDYRKNSQILSLN